MAFADFVLFADLPVDCRQLATEKAKTIYQMSKIHTFQVILGRIRFQGRIH
jgi:hypothetical protein